MPGALVFGFGSSVLGVVIIKGPCQKTKDQRPKTSTRSRHKDRKFFERDHGAVVMAAPLGGRGAPHRPVLLEETLKFLAPERGGLFVDCTVGLGGHSEAMLKSSSDTRVIGMDLDPAALEYARQRLAPFGERFRAFQANFRAIAEVLRASK